MKTKILIIKLGYSETLDPEINRVSSLGDVLRTTPILSALKEKFPDSSICWLVDKDAAQLLHGNPLIDTVLVWDEFVPFQLMREKFDLLINLEKIPGICALSDMIDSWTKYGFRFDSVSGTYNAYERGLDFIEYIRDKKAPKNRDYWQKVLIEMLGVKWRGQEYVIGYRPKTKEKFDVGLNFAVGEKWPHKAMPFAQWETLAKLLEERGYSVSFQRGLENLFEYMDWLNQCRIIVTNDSLGLHLALALKKKVVGLFGPTDFREVYFYGNCTAIRSRARCRHMPCYTTKCLSGVRCMEQIDPAAIVAAVTSLKKK
jgi:heptosyltransferase II